MQLKRFRISLRLYSSNSLLGRTTLLLATLLCCISFLPQEVTTSDGLSSPCDEDSDYEGYEWVTDADGNKVCSDVEGCDKECANGAVCNFAGICQCLAGFKGTLCSEKCAEGYYGKGCKNRCQCQQGACDFRTGECSCDPGYTGSNCASECDSGYHGPKCAYLCASECRDAVGVDVTSKVCDHINGQCTCLPGKYGDWCEKRCSESMGDSSCLSNPCSCENGGNCTEDPGTCKCPPGFYQKNDCHYSCPEGRFGVNCQGTCPSCNRGKCDKVSGECICDAGYSGYSCNNRCPAGSWGVGCRNKCDCPFNLNCDPFNGDCICDGNVAHPGACSIIYEECPRGMYGKYCQHSCGCQSTTNANYCHRLTGECLKCDQAGKNCKPADKSSSSSSLIIILVLIATVCGILIAIISLIIFRRVTKHRQKTKHQDARSAARLMLTPDEVTFHRDPVTGAVQAYCTLGASRRNLDTTPGNVPVNSELSFDHSDVKKGPLFVGLPSTCNGYSTVPQKTHSYDDGAPLKGARVELPYMIPIPSSAGSSSRNPFQPTIPNEYSVEEGGATGGLSNFNPFSPNEPLGGSRESYESGCYETIPGENVYEEMNYASIYDSRSPTGTLQYDTRPPQEPSAYNIQSETYGRSQGDRLSTFLPNQAYLQPESQYHESEQPSSPNVYGAQVDLYGGSPTEEYSL